MELGLHEGEVKSALKLFHFLNIILYYPGISDLVFVLPHSLIAVVSELMEFICKVRNGVPVGRCGYNVKEMVDFGIISKSVLCKFQKFTSIASSFPSFNEEIFHIFKHLLIAKDMPDGKFFMPALLPLIDPSDVAFSNCPLLFYFEKGAPIGLFCAMVVYILNTSDEQSIQFYGSNKWSLDQSNKAFSNCITLTYSGIEGKVLLIESNDWFEVHCDVHDRLIVKDAIKQAIVETLKKRPITTETPKLAFYCPHNGGKDHIAILKPQNTLTCIKDNANVIDKEGQYMTWIETQCTSSSSNEGIH